MLYALGVGAGAVDPTGAELEFTTENSTNVVQKVLPTFASLLSLTPRNLNLGDIDYTKLVHGEQTISLNKAIPPVGLVDVTTLVAGILDKGSGCLIQLDCDVAEVDTDELMFTTRMGLFMRGAGGFGGTRASSTDSEGELAAQPRPSRAADQVVSYETRRDQALLYRLSGDHNPLHSDPAFAKRAGFDLPILHGLCTYGFTGRALLHSVCQSDPERFRSMRCRFSRPVFPGDVLKISVWDVSDEYPETFRFQTENQNGEVVLAGGILRAT
jgi:acyl dehydratase